MDGAIVDMPVCNCLDKMELGKDIAVKMSILNKLIDLLGEEKGGLGIDYPVTRYQDKAHLGVRSFNCHDHSIEKLVMTLGSRSIVGSHPVCAGEYNIDIDTTK